MKKKILKVCIFAIMAAAFCNVSIVYANDEINEESIETARKYYKQGVEYTRTRAYDSAINAFRYALEYDPKMTDAYFNIASLYIYQQKYDEAYNEYVKLLSINPKDYDSILQVAKIAYNRKDYALALKYLNCIPKSYERYDFVYRMKQDAQEMFDAQKNRIERAKMTTASKSKKVLIDNLTSPAGMIVDSEGNMFVASYADNTIIKIDKIGNRTNFAKDYLLEGPVGIAIDNYDNIYVANYDGNNILKITKGGNTSVFMDNVAHPYFLYIKDDVLYISEQGNDAVVKYNLSSR